MDGIVEVRARAMSLGGAAEARAFPAAGVFPRSSSEASQAFGSLGVDVGGEFSVLLVLEHRSTGLN